MEATLSNCSRCGKLFVRLHNSICPTCMKEIEEEYIICSNFLRENKLVNIYELSEHTGVTVKQITQFIREGRISVADLPNMGYPCDACGEPIKEGKLCKKCSDRLKKDLKKALGDHESADGLENKQNAYYQIGQRFRSDK